MAYENSADTANAKAENALEVVAALIWDKDRFLICRRAAGKARGLLWELAGGKVERGETKQAALARECREELGIELCVAQEFAQVVHEYPDVTVRLTLFNASITSGEPQRLEHEELRWITAHEIPLFEFCPADAALLQKLR